MDQTRRKKGIHRICVRLAPAEIASQNGHAICRDDLYSSIRARVPLKTSSAQASPESQASCYSLVLLSKSAASIDLFNSPTRIVFCALLTRQRSTGIARLPKHLTSNAGRKALEILGFGRMTIRKQRDLNHARELLQPRARNHINEGIGHCSRSLTSPRWHFWTLAD